MWCCYDGSYEDVDEDPGDLTHHHIIHGPSQLPYDYDIGIGLHSSEQGIFGVGQHYNHVCFPVSYMTVNNDGQEQESHHSMYPQMMMTNHIPHPPIPEPIPSLQSLMLSPSSLPHSYLMYPSSMAQQIHQVPSPSQPPPPPLPPLPLTIGSNTTQQHEQCINNYNNSGTTNINNTEVTDERITSDALPYLRQLQSKERAIADGMTSSVIIHDSILSRQQLPNNDEIAESIQPLTGPQMKPTNGIKHQNTVAVDDNKVVTVCKQTILTSINKIIADNYESALHKLRKIIRVLDILMFNEGGSGIGSAKIETVRPWLETLKGMEERVSLKHRQQHQKKNNRNSENSIIVKAEHSYRRQVRQKIRYNSCSRNVNNGSTTLHYYKNASSGSSFSSENYGSNLHQIWRKSNNRRYRTTGKLIMEQNRHNLDHLWNRWIY